jgi:hypothetical protein
MKPTDLALLSPHRARFAVAQDAQRDDPGVAQGRGGQDIGAVRGVLEKLAGIERKR